MSNSADGIFMMFLIVPAKLYGELALSEFIDMRLNASEISMLYEAEGHTVAIMKEGTRILIDKTVGEFTDMIVDGYNRAQGFTGKATVG